jgi:hypothetical protein
MSDDEKRGLSDLLKSAINTGIGAAFMTEEAIRKNLADTPIGQESIQKLIDQAKSAKTEFTQSIKSELKSFLGDIDISSELDRVLNEYDLKFDIKLSFSKKDKEKNTEE